MILSNFTKMLDAMLTKWHERRSIRAVTVEQTTSDPKPLAQIATAKDVQVSVDALREIAVKGTGADRLMLRMITAYGIDIKQMHAEAPTMLRDVVMLCSKCREKERCARELDAGTAAEHAHEFCPNAEAFVSMR